MARHRRTVRPASQADLILEPATDATLLDLLDRLLNKGVVLRGDVVLGVAGVDLVYLQLSALLSAIDRIFGGDSTSRRRRRTRAPRKLRRPPR
jgi:gas vesicle structural protein